MQVGWRDRRWHVREGQAAGAVLQRGHRDAGEVSLNAAWSVEQAAVGDAMTMEHVCPKCQSREVDRVPRKDLLERLLLLLRCKRICRLRGLVDCLGVSRRGHYVGDRGFPGFSNGFTARVTMFPAIKGIGCGRNARLAGMRWRRRWGPLAMRQKARGGSVRPHGRDPAPLGDGPRRAVNGSAGMITRGIHG